MPEFLLMSVGIAVETTFTQALPFVDANCVPIAKACLDSLSRYGLQAGQIALRRRDTAFNYELSFQLFNGNGTFKLTADKLNISLAEAAANIGDSGRADANARKCLTPESPPDEPDPQPATLHLPRPNRHRQAKQRARPCPEMDDGRNPGRPGTAGRSESVPAYFCAWLSSNFSAMALISFSFSRRETIPQASCTAALACSSPSVS